MAVGKKSPCLSNDTILFTNYMIFGDKASADIFIQNRKHFPRDHPVTHLFKSKT